MRLFSSKSNFTELSSLNLSSHVSKALSEAAAQPQGLILVTGPTGSGKSTTLFSLLNDIHHREPELNIMTIENPVEQEAEAFSQIEVDDNMDFAQALRALLRQDPNIILVGEIRDKETAEVSINAALTGHLVLSTIHTRNAHLALDRLRELGINPGVIAEACLAITAQRLPRKICPNCRVQVYLKDRKDLYDRYKDDPFIKERPNFSFYEANEDGCDKCSGGYKGVCSAVELLSVDSYMEDAIRSGTSATEVRKSQIKDRSFTDIWGDAFRLIEEGSCDFATLEKAIGSYATARNI
jgi:type II secretory ATPase GspE/PulE/Tfp pilus assembly ATPase PilB-like protein